jgi:glycosyltransferase involved in cell wall biosynthesis
MPARVSIIVPAFDEAESIGAVLAGLVPMASENNWEIIVVDDGSGDDTAAVAGKCGVRVLSHARNRGYGASIATGIEAAASGIIVTFDADGQHDGRDIPGLLEHIEHSDMVVGARGGDSHADAFRVPGKKILAWFANYLSATKIPDVNSGLRVFKRDVMLKYIHLMPEGFSFSVTSTLAFLKGGHAVDWVPIRSTRRIGTSTVRQFRHGPQVMMLILRLTVLFDPLRVFLPVSLLLMLLGLLMTVLNFVLYRAAVPASAVFLGTSAVLVFMLGLLADQISAMRRERYRGF